MEKSDDVATFEHGLVPFRGGAAVWLDSESRLMH